MFLASSGLIIETSGIEQFRKSLDYAQVGDNTGLLLRGVEKKQLQKGDLLIK